MRFKVNTHPPKNTVLRRHFPIMTCRPACLRAAGTCCLHLQCNVKFRNVSEVLPDKCGDKPQEGVIVIVTVFRNPDSK
jgi:hypothetical protein